MPETSDGWSEFKSADNTTIKCLVKNGYLEMVIMESTHGWTIDVDPDYVNKHMIETGLNRTIKLH